MEQSENRSQRTLTYNDNNQLITYERPKSSKVRGYVNEYTTNVVVKSNTATNWIPATVRFLSSTQSYFEADVTITNSGTNNYIWVRATDKSGNRSTNTVRVTSTPTSTAFSHDADGNQLTLSSTVSMSFDARNRPTRINYSDGYTVLKYDGFDRLREVAEYNSGSVLTSLVRYVWNGWTPWAELNSTNGVVRTFTFGVDLSGTVGGAAGIGGLLAIRQGGTNYYVCSDGKGNVTEVRRTNGTVAASYGYGPFGQLLYQTNTYNQPFRFSTRLYHAHSGFVYMLGRWYDPNAGRFLSRDPSGEGNGINIYQFARSSPQNYIDPDGRNAILAAVLAGAVWAAVYTPLNANGPSEDSPQYEPTTPEEVAWNAAVGGLTAGVFAWAGSMIGSVGPKDACPVTVSRWGRPGLEPGDWVMKGNPNLWNYLMSGKYQPSWMPGDNIPASFSSGQAFPVPASALKTPSGVVGPFKAAIGQRIYKP